MSRHNERKEHTPAGDAHDERRRLFHEAIERYYQELLRGIGFYLWRFGTIADREGITERAKEVLQETVATALGILDRYDPSRSAKLWLLNVAVIVIKRRTRQQRREHRRLILVADSEDARRTAGNRSIEEMSEAELFDALHRPVESPSSQLPNAEEILALVEGDDQEILRLHYLEGLNGEELAAKFGVSKGVVYQRLSRARIKVRQAYFGEEN